MTNAEIFYQNHFVLRWVIYISVNEGYQLTYSSPKKLENQISASVKEYSDLLKSAISRLNETFYSDPQSYYQFRFNNKDLLD
jgi:hypothetical protein